MGVELNQSDTGIRCSASDTQTKTLTTYEGNFEKYLTETPSKVSGDFKNFFQTILLLLPLEAVMLEIGSGTGRDADYFEEHGVTVLRTDATQSFIKYQRQNGKMIIERNILIHEIGYDWNVIFANAVLLHFTKEEFSFVLMKMARSLAPNGIIAFTVKVGTGEEWSTHKMDAPRFFKYWELHELQTVVEECGYKITYLQYATEGTRLFCIASI